MANCNHPGAECVMGNLYLCRTAGCSNERLSSVQARSGSTKAAISPGPIQAAGREILHRSRDGKYIIVRGSDVRPDEPRWWFVNQGFSSFEEAASYAGFGDPWAKLHIHVGDDTYDAIVAA